MHAHRGPDRIFIATTVQAKCTDMPPTGRSIQARELATRPGSSGPSKCSFSLPLRPSRISPVKQGCYRALPMGWEAARTLPPIWSLNDLITFR